MNKINLSTKITINPKIITPAIKPKIIPVSMQFLLFSLFALMHDAEQKKHKRIGTTNCKGYVKEKISEYAVFFVITPNKMKDATFKIEKIKPVREIEKYLFTKIPPYTLYYSTSLLSRLTKHQSLTF